ncbi:MAG: membrane dipeptidase [Eubacteriales bacterium]|nr:membrane dipeptidase [Eubacteriales bacterium]
MREIIDLHCDTVLLSSDAGKTFHSWNGHINIDKLKAGGCLAQCFALFIPAFNELSAYHFDNMKPIEIYETLLKAYKAILEDSRDEIRPAYSPDDIAENTEKGFISSILTVEDGMLLDGCIDRVDTLWQDGVRMLALTWNYENSIGHPNSADSVLHTTKGLKDFGFEVVERMNQLGMIIDVSHLSEAGFMDVARSSKKPFAASHSCSRSLCDHSRNLTDEQLHILGDCGGVVGVNFYSRFLTEGSDDTKISDIVKHMVHIKNKAGMESLSWGSDFDGFESTIEFGDYSGFGMLTDALSKEFTDDEIDMINNGNFLRIFREVQN